MISGWGNYPELDSAGRPGVGYEARLVRAPAIGVGGCRFETCHIHKMFFENLSAEGKRT